MPRTTLLRGPGQWLRLDINGRQTLHIGVTVSPDPEDDGAPVLFVLLPHGDVSGLAGGLDFCYGMVRVVIDRTHPGPQACVALEAPEKVSMHALDGPPCGFRPDPGNVWTRREKC